MAELLHGTIVNINPKDNLGVIRCKSDDSLHIFILGNVKGYINQDFNEFGLVEGNTVKFIAIENAQGPMAVRVEITEKKDNLLAALYWYTIRNMWRSKLFYVYPLLLWTNPFNSPSSTLKTKIIVSILYVLLIPYFVAKSQRNIIQSRSKK